MSIQISVKDKSLTPKLRYLVTKHIGSVELQERILAIGDRILNFDPRIQEHTGTRGEILFGRVKSVSCAAVRYFDDENALRLYLWLPRFALSSKGEKPLKALQVPRFKVVMDSGWSRVLQIVHIPEGRARQQTKQSSSPYLPNQYSQYLDKYPELNVGNVEEVDALVDLALEMWRRREDKDW